jgi:5-methylthioadenosine/S-adenosylhomocysteine deaminase
MGVLILHGYVVTMNTARDVFDDGYVLVADDGRIAEVGPAAQAPAGHAGPVIDARGMIVVPGLVNTHQHLWQHLVMGMDAAGTRDGLRRIRAALDPQDLRVAAALAAAEMLGGGTTCVLHHAVPGADAQALEATMSPLAALGMRQTVAIDHPGADAGGLDAALARWHGADDGRVRLAVHVETDVCAVAQGRVHESDISAAYAFAQAHGLRLTTDTAPGDDTAAWEAAMRRTGRSGVMHMMELGVLDSRWLLVHGDRLRENGRSADARVRVPCRGHTHGRRRAGAGSCGLDGAVPCRRSLRTGKRRSGGQLHGGHGGADEGHGAGAEHGAARPTSMSAEAALEMATLGGARALGLDGEIGSLEVGKRADIAVFDMRGPHFQTSHKPISGLVCCARGSDVHVVLVDGCVVWKDGAPAMAWEPEALAREGVERGARLVERAARVPVAAPV